MNNLYLGSFLLLLMAFIGFLILGRLTSKKRETDNLLRICMEYELVILAIGRTSRELIENENEIHAALVEVIFKAMKLVEKNNPNEAQD